MNVIGKINRRFYLKGIGGATLALPFLELLRGNEARAQAGADTRYVLCYTGQAMGADGDDSQHRFRPDVEGPLLDLPQLPLSLQPLGGRENWSGEYRHPRHGDYVEPIRNWPGDVFDVRDKISVISGLRLPSSGPASADTPAHRGTVSPNLSGTSSFNSSATCNGPTSDVIVEETFGTQAVRCLVQAGNYGNGGRNDNAMSWRRAGEAIVGQVSPQAMYRALFEGFVPDPSLVDEQAQARALARRVGVLDLVLSSTHRLESRLGMEDKQRLQAHLDGLTTLRRRVEELGLAEGEGCGVPADPGQDPPYTGGQGGDAGGGGHDPGEGWSQEEKRAEAFIDMLTMALACGLTRVGTIQFSYTQSFINGEDPTGLRGDQHQIGHGGNVERANGSPNDSVALCHHYPVRYFGYLVGKLANTMATPDRSLLDDAAVGLVFEAGHGNDGGRMTAHSGDEMCALVAGGAGGLRQGEHIRLPGEHPARVLSSMLGAVGCEPRLGDINGVLDRLFV